VPAPCAHGLTSERAAQMSVRFTHNRDIVPAWPPTWVGFHHVATEVWQVDFGLGSVRPRRAAC